MSKGYFSEITDGSEKNRLRIGYCQKSSGQVSGTVYEVAEWGGWGAGWVGS